MGNPSKKAREKKGETSLALLPSTRVQVQLWKPDFSTVELGKQVIVADSAKVAQAIMLQKDMADLTKEGSEEILDLFVMQQVQVSIVTSGTF